MYLKYLLKRHAEFMQRQEFWEYPDGYRYPVLSLAEFIKQHKPCPMHDLCDHCLEVLHEAEKPFKLKTK